MYLAAKSARTDAPRRAISAAIAACALIAVLASCGGSDSGSALLDTDAAPATAEPGSLAVPIVTVAPLAAEGTDQAATDPATGAPAASDAGSDAAQAEVDARIGVPPPISLQGESALGKYPERVYVPNTLSNTVHVIDPFSYEIIATYPTDAIPHHVTPSWDLTELYVLNTGGNSLLVMDPATGTPKETIPVIDPYNLYFTPDGENAIVVAERLRRLDIADPDTWEVHTQVSVPWPGVDHMAFARDGSYLVTSTEFSGRIVKVDTRTWEVVGEPLSVGGEPIDVVRLPKSNIMLVANQGIDHGGVHVVDPDSWEVIDWIETGLGAHGIMLTHDQERLFVSNRGRATGTGSITVLDAKTLQLLDTWRLPGSASPDMGQLNPDGSEFWIAGRYDNEVYVISTTDGSLVARIPTDAGPHGLTYFPSSPMPHSVGHNGVYMID